MSRRTDMLGSTVRAIIAPVLRDAPAECGIVSITKLEVSSDASYATVWVSSLKEPALALEFLEGRRRELQHSLKALQRRRIPLLRFRMEKDVDRLDRLDRILEGSQKDDEA